MLKRDFELVGTGVSLPISRGTIVDVRRQFLHMDELEDGTWRITVTKSLTDNVAAIEHIAIVDSNNPRSILEFAGLKKRFPIAQIVTLGKAVDRPGMIHFEDNGRGMWKVLMYVKDVVPSALGKVEMFKINRTGDEHADAEQA